MQHILKKVESLQIKVTLRFGRQRRKFKSDENGKILVL